MQDFTLFDGEYRLIQLVWSLQPIGSTELWVTAEKELGWKKSTTYSVLRKLCTRGLLQNKNTTVTALVTKQDVQKHQSSQVVKKNFENSLPGFVAAFLQKQSITEQEALQIKKMIEEATQK